MSEQFSSLPTLLDRFARALDRFDVFAGIYESQCAEVHAAGGHEVPPVDEGPFSLVGSSRQMMHFAKEIYRLGPMVAEHGESLGIDTSDILNITEMPALPKVNAAKNCLARIRARMQLMAPPPERRRKPIGFHSEWG